MKKAVMLGALLTSWGALAAGGELVKLRVVERAGVERKAEPVTCGVPFPKGLLRGTGHLTLLDAAGKPVPASFTAVNFWPKDKSVRWALLDTQLSVAARGTATFGVAVAVGKPRMPSAPVQVTEEGGLIKIHTGALMFEVRKNGFRLFEAVSVLTSTRSRKSWWEVLGSHPEGLAMTIGGKRYTSAADTESKVIVEEKTPMRVTLLATGKLAGPGPDRYDYEVRIHAYSGSTRVKIVATVTKKYGKPRDMKHYIEDLSLGFKLRGAKDLKFALGGDGAPATGKLAAGQKAHVIVRKSTSWEFGGEAKGSGDPKARKPLTIGWGNLVNANRGVAVGVHRFWQTFPKAIELCGDGTINVGLYPKLAGKKLQFFTGMARTHEVLLYFHDGKAKPADIQKVFVGFQKPLFAAAPPEWYCQKTGVFGTLAAAGSKLAGEGTKEFANFDKRISGYFDKLSGPGRDKWSKRGVTIDTYGWLAFGDTLHYVWKNGKSKGTPWDIAWDSNYYDLAHIAAMYFARTGEAKYLEWFRDQTWHFMDIDVCHWNPGFKQGGSSRRCPATNHVGFDPPEHMSPIINVAFSHHKSESLFERYYLFGDRRALKVGMELAEHARRYKDADYGGTRKPGHQIISLLAGYRHTGDKKYLERAKKVIDVGIVRQDRFDGLFNARVRFTDGILLESFAKYYLATGEAQVLKAIRRTCDKFVDDGAQYANWTFAFALLYRETGEDKYLKAALKTLWRGKPNHLSKDMGHMYRSAPNATGMLLPGKK